MNKINKVLVDINHIIELGNKLLDAYSQSKCGNDEESWAEVVDVVKKLLYISENFIKESNND